MMESDNSNEEEEHSTSTSWEELSHADRLLINAMENNRAAALHRAIRNGANVRFCVCFEDAGGIVHRVTPLYLACCTEDRNEARNEIVSILLDMGANAQWKNHNGSSAILVACMEGHLSIVETLFDHDNDLLEIASNDGKTPLMVACDHQQTDIVQFLLERGANVKATDATGGTPLMRACKLSHLESTRLLLAEGRCDVDARDKNQQTALHCAAFFGFIGGVRALILEHNANMLLVDKNGRTPFDLAVLEGRDDVVDFLLQLYANKMVQEHGPLAVHAVLCSAEYSFAEDDQFHPPLLSLRIRLALGQLTLAQLRTVLHSLDAELIRNQDDSGKLPIHIACRNNAPVEVLTLLVELDPTTLQIAENTGSLPLHLLCCGMFTPPEYASALYLVEQGGVGTLAVRNRQGALPLHYLCVVTNAPLRTVQYLIQAYPVALNAPLPGGLYLFMAAACEESSASLSLVYELIRANPNLIVPKE